MFDVVIDGIISIFRLGDGIGQLTISDRQSIRRLQMGLTMFNLQCSMW